MAVAVKALSLLTLLAVITGLHSALPAWALGAAEPFVPPRRQAVVNAGASAGASAAASAAAHATPAAGAQPAADAPALPDQPGDAVAAGGLRGVRLGQRPQALIDGQWVAAGQAVRGAQLVAVQADHALLRWADGRTERLALAGQIELVRRTRAASASASTTASPRSAPALDKP